MLQNAQMQLVIFGCDIHGLGYAIMTHPNPKSCSKCCKMPKCNFSFLGVICLVGGVLKIPQLNLKIQIFKCPYEIEIHKFPLRHKISDGKGVRL